MRVLLRIGLLAVALVAASGHDVLAAFHPAPDPVAPRAAAQGSEPLWGRARAVSFSHVPSAPFDPPLVLPGHIIARTDLPLRAQPCAEAPVLASLPRGSHAPVRAVLAGGEWLEVTWQGQRGWVAAAGVEVAP